MKNKQEKIDANTLFGFSPKRKLDISLDTLLRTLEKYEIHKALTISAKAIHYDYAEGNEETLKVCQANPDILVPTFSLNPLGYFEIKDEIRRRVEQGFKMCRVFPELQGWPIEYLPFVKLLEELEEFRMPLAISGRMPGTITKLLKLIKGYSFPLIITNITYNNLAEGLAAGKEYYNLYIESHPHGGPDALEIMVAELGEERIIFGSGCPTYSLSAAFLQVERSCLTIEQKSKIFKNNILNILERK
ncbi:MAG: amidohydrolase family protein [Phycisphaerae bacterium]|nr:amidohydrolase family protein [Phycisphaerae bacterium]